MAFAEKLKLAVKRLAHFRCCLCHNLGVEIHHIIPQSESGSDEEDNAAPLCPSCHETYGANPEKRKFIKEARDFWYEICENRYPSEPSKLEDISERLNSTASKSDLENAVQKINDIIAGALLKDAPKADDTDDGEQLLSLSLPERHWVVVLGALEPFVRKNVEYIRLLSGGKKVTATSADQLVSRLPEQFRTALAGPIIIRSVLIDLLVDAGVIKERVKDEMGSSALLKMINGYNEEIDRELVQNGVEIKMSNQTKEVQKSSRNSLCSCGSGRKYKYCCGRPQNNEKQ